MRLVHEKQQTIGAARPRLQMVDQRQAQLAFIHVAVRELELEQDILQQCPPRSEPRSCQMSYLKSPAEVPGQNQAQERFAGSSDSNHQPRAFGPIDAPDERLPGAVERARRDANIRLGCSRKRTLRQTEITLVHRRTILL